MIITTSSLLIAGPWHPNLTSLSVLCFVHFCFSLYIRSSTTPILGQPPVLLPFILATITTFVSPSPFKTWSIQFFSILIILSSKHFFFPMKLSTSSIVFQPDQLTFSILLYTHISKALSLYISSVLDAALRCNFEKTRSYKPWFS